MDEITRETLKNENLFSDFYENDYKRIFTIPGHEPSKYDLIREKINTLKFWPGSPDSADKAFLRGVAKDLEMLLAECEKARQDKLSFNRAIERMQGI